MYSGNDTQSFSITTNATNGFDFWNVAENYRMKPKKENKSRTIVSIEYGIIYQFKYKSTEHLKTFSSVCIGNDAKRESISFFFLKKKKNRENKERIHSCVFGVKSMLFASTMEQKNKRKTKAICIFDGVLNLIV